jgi:hypothetical protein
MTRRAPHVLIHRVAGAALALALALAPAAASSAPRLKALGDTADDVVYTPVTPCRLVETRGTFAAVYQGGGAFTANEIRNYAIQGGNGVCLSQLPAGLHPSAVQLQVFGMPTTPASGDIEILPQGTAFGTTATMVYVGSIAFNTVSTNAKINTANNQISVQVRGGGAHVAIDVVGYFRKEANTTTNAFEAAVGGSVAWRLLPDTFSPIVVGGANNSVTPGASGAVIGGGGAPGTNFLIQFGNIGIGVNCNGSCANRVTDLLGTVSGGAANQAGNGTDPSNDSAFATVGGGIGNLASGMASAVTGGGGNVASGDSSAIGGGSGNTASGDSSAIGGGEGNLAAGFSSSVPGGTANKALGTDSIAMGFTANANGDGCFVFGDVSTSSEVRCDAPNRVVMRGTGGIYMFAGGTEQENYKGVVLPIDGQAWIAMSDRAGKENLQAVDSKAVLAKVVAMPIATWNWKTQDAAIRHMGPMAQDFAAAFGLGETNKGITTIDADGVALAAIQGLRQMIVERDARIERLEHELDLLRDMVGKLAGGASEQRP